MGPRLPVGAGGRWCSMVLSRDCRIAFDDPLGNTGICRIGGVAATLSPRSNVGENIGNVSSLFSGAFWCYFSSVFVLGEWWRRRMCVLRVVHLHTLVICATVGEASVVAAAAPARGRVRTACSTYPDQSTGCLRRRWDGLASNGRMAAPSRPPWPCRCRPPAAAVRRQLARRPGAARCGLANRPTAFCATAHPAPRAIRQHSLQPREA